MLPYATYSKEFVCIIVHEHAAAFMHVHWIKTEQRMEREREKERKRDSERVHCRYLSASDREDSPEGRSQPFSTENDT